MCLGIAGCSSGDREVDAPPPSAAEVPHDHDGDGKPDHEGDAAEAAPQGMPELNRPETVLAVDKAEAAYDKASKAFGQSKDDGKAKQALVDATVALADANMFNDELPPNVKYRAALKYYREALKLDPKHEHATAAKVTIEEIYKSMGRPVPDVGG